MQKDEELLKKRLQEFSSQAYYRGIVTYSDFMNLNELNILHSIPHSDLYTRFETFGGYELSERQMAAFIPDALYCEINYPLIPVKIAPLNKKFTEELTHRDYLGAILNLGINRNKVGDILVGTNTAKGSGGSLQEQEAILFLQDVWKRSPFVVKHTTKRSRGPFLVAMHPEEAAGGCYSLVPRVPADTGCKFYNRSRRKRRPHSHTWWCDCLCQIQCCPV